MMSSKQLPYVAGSLAIILALALAIRRQAEPAWSVYRNSAEVRVLTPRLTSEPELCLTCHEGIEEISESHSVDAFGCVVCHGGDRLSLDLETVHDSLIGAEGNLGNPSDLSTVETTCGGTDCHSGDAAQNRNHIELARMNLHTTYAGGVNETLAALGAPRGEVYYGLVAETDAEPAHAEAVAQLEQLTSDIPGIPDIAQFISNCQGCHSGTQEPPQQEFYYRGTGCAACHVFYTPDGIYQGGDPTTPRDEPGHPALHKLTTAIPYSTCNSCHNRGTYDSVSLAFTPRSDLSTEGMPEAQARLAEIYPPDSSHYVSCEVTLDCIDCHTGSEVMGDGDLYTSQQDATRIECRTCHGTLDEYAPIVTLEDVNDLAFRRGTLNPFYDVFLGNTVVLGPDGEPLEHIRVEGEFYSLTSKANGSTYMVPQVRGSACEQDVNEQDPEDCQECHTYDPANPN